ncbi:hypothetical protein TNCV_1655451 [Trichonephila clavipes]|nr:hypothetical protein TNCV_1655451 [Trichonephila clavipes]
MATGSYLTQNHSRSQSSFTSELQKKLGVFQAGSMDKYVFQSHSVLEMWSFWVSERPYQNLKLRFKSYKKNMWRQHNEVSVAVVFLWLWSQILGWRCRGTGSSPDTTEGRGVEGMMFVNFVME